MPNEEILYVDPVSSILLDLGIDVSKFSVNKQVLINALRKDFEELDRLINRFELGKNRENLYAIVEVTQKLKTLIKMWENYGAFEDAVLRNTINKALEQRLHKVLQ